MTLAQESEMKHKKYESINDDDLSVMQVSAVHKFRSAGCTRTKIVHVETIRIVTRYKI